MARRPIKIKIESLKRSKLYGCADIAGRTITIDIDAHKTEKALLDTVCHEVLHVASDDFLSEAAIEKLAADLSDTLYRLRWRRLAS